MATLTVTSIVSGVPAVPAGMQDDWFNGLSFAAAGKIPFRWNAFCGSPELWTANVSTPSSKAYAPMIAADFISKREHSKTIITGLQRKKLQNAQAKAKAAFDLMFANAGANYIQRVNDKAGNFSANMPNTLALTGSRAGGRRGPASIHVRAIASDQGCLRDAGAGTTIAGNLDPRDQDTPEFRYLKPGMAGALRAGLEGMLTQVGVFILDQVITDATPYNTIMTDFLTGVLRVSYTGTITFTPGGGGFTLVTSISGTDPVVVPDPGT